MPPSGRTLIVTVTVVEPNETAGADIRPVVGRPLAQAISHTRMCIEVEPGPGGEKAGSGAHIAGSNPAGTVSVAGASVSGGTGHVGSGDSFPTVPHPDSNRAAITGTRTRPGTVRMASRTAHLPQWP